MIRYDFIILYLKTSLITFFNLPHSVVISHCMTEVKCSNERMALHFKIAITVLLRNKFLDILCLILSPLPAEFFFRRFLGQSLR